MDSDEDLDEDGLTAEERAELAALEAEEAALMGSDEELDEDGLTAEERAELAALEAEEAALEDDSEDSFDPDMVDE